MTDPHQPYDDQFPNQEGRAKPVHYKPLAGIGPVARNPLLLGASIAALVLAPVSLITQFGVPLAGHQNTITAATGLLCLFVTAVLGRSKVTPLRDPRDADGTRLIPRPLRQPTTLTFPIDHATGRDNPPEPR